MASAGYLLTRRAKRSVIVSRLTTSETDPQSGERTVSRSTIPVRNVVIEPTSHKHRIAAKEAEQDVGDTTILFYTGDIPFDRLAPTDCIIDGDRKMQVVSSVVESDILRATARELVGQASPVPVP